MTLLVRSGGKGRPQHRLVGVGLTFVLVSILVGCSTLPRSAPPQELVASAVISGLPPEARAFGLEADANLQADFAQAMLDGKDEKQCDMKDGHPVFCILILSGGGGYGAYGAGVLNGWSASGLRPEFKVVTGVSTGALMAPYAFLGKASDDALKDEFTTVEKDEDIFHRRRLLRILRSESVATTEPLKARIDKAITTEVLQQIAAEHARGRRLYIGTTNMDAIGVRTIKSFTQAMGRSDLAQIYAISRARGADFHYTEVPEDFAWEADGVFDGDSMRVLYEIGYEDALTPELWSSTPPGTFARNIE